MAKDMLSNLRPPAGSRKKPKRIGRGQGSGHGGTSTRGHKGAGSRSGSGRPAWFEGGQMPLVRRVPKRGFFSPFRTEYQIVNLETLQKLSVDGRLQNGVVNPDRTPKPMLEEARKVYQPVGILPISFGFSGSFVSSTATELMPASAT